MSKYWKSNIVEKAYYVKSNQVSKSAPAGEYISTGSFMIRGKKNYLPQARLELGIGLLFITTTRRRITTATTAWCAPSVLQVVPCSAWSARSVLQGLPCLPPVLPGVLQVSAM